MGPKSQVYIASFITLCAVVALILLGARGVQQIEWSNSEVSEHVLPQLRYLERMRFGVIRVVSSTSELIVGSLTGGHGATAVETLETKLIREGEREFLAAYKGMANLHSPQYDHPPPINSADLLVAFERLQAGAQRIIELTESNATPMQFAQAKEDFEQLELTALGAIDQVFVRAEDLAHTELERITDSIGRLHDQIMGLGLISAVTLLFYSMFVTRLIRREEQARLNAEKLAQANEYEVERRKRIERRLASHQKLEALGTMLGGIAHSVNNFLTPIRTLTSLLKKGLPADAEQQVDLDHILRSAKNASAVLKEVLAFSRGSESNTDVTELVSCVRTALSVSRAALPSSVTLQESSTLSEAWVLAKEADIAAIILNLTSNAMDAMEGRTGCISVDLAEVRVADGVVDGTPVRLESGDYIRLRFADTGSGVSAEALPNIFDPFFTTKGVGKGSGLGLSVTYSIVSQAGGDIVVDSRTGAGTRFDILLPARERPAADAAA